jgi:hypothetical protein
MSAFRRTEMDLESDDLNWAGSTPDGVDTAGEALAWADAEDELVLVHTGSRCPECGGPLIVAAGPKAGRFANTIANQHPQIGPVDAGWLAEEGRGLVYCDIEQCSQAAHTDYSGGSLEVIEP